jgi:N-acetylmuramoyl-L-alanine amidase
VIRCVRGVALVVLVLSGAVVAVGCTGPSMVSEVPLHSTNIARDDFAYEPLNIPPRPVKPELPQPSRVQPVPMKAQPPVRPEPFVPAHDAAWDITIPSRPWRWIVVHHSGADTGSAAIFDAFHRNVRKWDELGYHFVIGDGTGSADGLVEVGSRWPKQKWGAHCRVGDNEEYNDYGIGICLVGDFEKHRPTATQMASLVKLVDYLAAKYHIDDAHIIGHGTVDDTKCPGRFFPMNDLLAQLRKLRASRGVLATGWPAAAVPAS